MIWYVDKDRSVITFSYKNENRVVGCSSQVASLPGDYRRNHPIKSIPSGEWYNPLPFPSGKFKITGRPIIKNRETSPYVWPYFIPTDAGRYVETWIVENGAYVRATDQEVWDSAYGFHCSDIDYTLGCIKITLPPNIELLAEVVNDCFDRSEDIFVLVAPNAAIDNYKVVM